MELVMSPWILSWQLLNGVYFVYACVLNPSWRYIWGCIQKFPYWVDNEINNNKKHSL